MGILDKSKSYRISGAKLNLTAPPPRVVKVHLKSHVYLNDVNYDPVLGSPSSLEESNTLSEEISALSQNNNSLFSVAESEVSVKSRDESIPGQMSPRELAFRLAFPKAMRNMLMSSRCNGNRRSSLPSEISLRQISDICSSYKESNESLSRRQSIKHALQSRRGSWCTNTTVIETRETDDNQRVWPGGRFHSFPDRPTLPHPKNKVEVIWNDSYSSSTYSRQEENTPLTEGSASVANRYSSKGNEFPFSSYDENTFVVETPSPTLCPNKPKLSKFISKCCM